MIFKNKGDTEDLDNYSPVALANCTAKILKY